MTERKEVNVIFIESILGQFVPKRKANMSHDCERTFGDVLRMPTDAAASAFKAEFIGRTKKAREQLGRTQEEMAVLLEIEQGKYKMYESRTPLPHRYVEKFCLICSINEAWLFSGKGRIARGVARASKVRAA